MIDIRQGSIRLRSAREQDARQLTTWWNDGAVMAHAGYPDGLGTTVQDTRAAIQRSEAEGGHLCIIEIEGAPVGECSLRKSGEEGRPGWKICEPAWQNRGYGTQLIRMTMDYLFSDPAIRWVRWDTMLDNARAQTVYQRLPGVQRLGVRENCWRDQRGAWRSAVDYALERADWQRWPPG